MAVSPNTFDCTDLGANTVTLTVTDVNGNSANCTATVTVTDNESPVITCPSDIAADTDAGDCEAVVTFSASATDNCSAIVTYSHASGSAFPVGTTTVTATATDPANNTDVCTFDIVVTDNESPVITCPSDIAADTDAGDCEAVVTFSASATDNCSGDHRDLQPCERQCVPCWDIAADHGDRRSPRPTLRTTPMCARSTSLSPTMSPR
jgi:hypothetical protein